MVNFNLHVLFFSKVDENLTEEERKAAWEEFENEKKGLNSLVGNPAVNNFANFNFNPEDIAVKLELNRHFLQKCGNLFYIEMYY